ncbi:ybl81 [Escherichia coli]|uniref:Ybl81 n=1 Tax=Escherichia coli TaxID=562 RepID=A0A376KX73_ECOLX|nr:ybl81 [Escherichia coli]
MEFKDLPPDTQKITARNTGNPLILDGGQKQVEPAKKLAQEIREAFIALYQSFSIAACFSSFNILRIVITELAASEGDDILPARINSTVKFKAATDG